MKRIVLIGAGQRGNIYAEEVIKSDIACITGVVEPNEFRRVIAQKRYNLDIEQIYQSSKDFFKKGKIADAIILANMDRDHYADATQSIELGYDILLEKPISPSLEEVIDLQEKADLYGCKVVVCHVLRYTEFFNEIKEIVDSGELGKVITIDHNENIGNYHMAHSFVRGNWRSSKKSSPLVLQKSCHDMDILTWLVNSEAKTVISFGDTYYFKEENAPEESSNRCFDCNVKKSCRFDAEKVYLPIRGEWPASVICHDQSKESLVKELRTSPYGRCVYRCDNDVCDSQVVLIEFKNGITVNFNLSAFTNKMFRQIKIMCEHGEILGEDYSNKIEVTKFTSNDKEKYSKSVIYPKVGNGFHGGGDTGLVIDFLNQISNTYNCDQSVSSIKKSVESHIMSHAAEISRISRTLVDVDLLKERLSLSKSK